MKRIVLYLILLPTYSYCQLSINEISANKGVIDGQIESDWIEIINTSNAPLNLSEYYLSDDIDDFEKWPFPDRVVQSGEIIQINASGEDITNIADHWEALVMAENGWRYYPGSSPPPSNWNDLSFNDNAWPIGAGSIGYGDGDDQTIISNAISLFMRRKFAVIDVNDFTEMILHADYDDAYVAYLNGVEISRSPNIDGFPPAYTTTANAEHEAGLYQGFPPDHIILDDEIFSNLLIQGENVLAIQVHNTSLISSDMTSNFFLTAGIGSPESLYQEIPDWFDESLVQGYFHCNFKIDLNETVFISDLDGNIVDGLNVSADLGYGISYGRSPDGADNWCYFDNPTPGESNELSWCYDGISAAPQFSAPSGWYDAPFNVGISSDNAIIHYTTNGDIPDENDPVYTDSILIDHTSILSARAFSNENLLPSKIRDRTFILDQDNYELSVFSVITDSLNLWDWEEGIYVSGPNASPNYPYFGSNFWEPWSKFSRVEYFDGNKEKLAEEQVDLEIHGGWSRAEAQKSFRLDFKSQYTGRLEVPLFSQKPLIPDVNNINLRNGGQHVWTDKIQDGLISRVVQSTHTDNMAYEPCILYLNGAYWGIYGIREKIDEHYIESNHSISSDDVDLLNSFGILHGSDTHFHESYHLIMNEPISSPEFYAMANSRFDLDNYKDYFIIETYIQNMDWLGIAWGANNIKLWRPNSEAGKWRYVLFDTDAAFGAFGQNIYANYLASARNPLFSNQHSELFDKMLKNNQFRCEFANRYADLMNTIFKDENFDEISNELVSELIQAMPDQVNRWGGPVSVSQWQNAVSAIGQYNSARVTTARNHVNSNLGLDGQFNIVLDVNPPGAGKIKISTIIPPYYPWEGVYFNGCPVSIEAIANEGFYFDHWTENDLLGSSTFEQNLLLELSANETFTANFSDSPVSVNETIENVGLEVFPNPSSGSFMLKLPNKKEQIFDVVISQMKGQIIQQFDQLKSNSKGYFYLDLSYLNQGIYNLELRAGNIFLNQKLVIL